MHQTSSYHIAMYYDEDISLGDLEKCQIAAKLCYVSLILFYDQRKPVQHNIYLSVEGGQNNIGRGVKFAAMWHFSKFPIHIPFRRIKVEHSLQQAFLQQENAISFS